MNIGIGALETLRTFKMEQELKMTYMVVPLSVSQYSSSPVADAIAKISAIVGSSVTPAALQQLYWNDPCTSLGNGTGRWQFQISYTYQPTGDTDPVTLVVSCQGNASTSVGGMKASAPPSFTGMTQVNSPLMPFNGLGSVGGKTTGTGGSSVIYVGVEPTDPSIGNELGAIVKAVYNGSGGAFYYYYDSQTSLGNGTGIWRLYGIAWNSTNTCVIGTAGGCALSSAGGPAAIPAPSFTGYTKVSGFLHI